jgi:hypothetical protein
MLETPSHNSADDGAAAHRELLVLRLLCQLAPTHPLRPVALRVTVQHNWQDPSRQVIFEALADIPSDNPKVIRGLLPAHLTRKGFPDVNVEMYFLPHGLTPREMEDLLKSFRRPNAPQP